MPVSPAATETTPSQNREGRKDRLDAQIRLFDSLCATAAAAARQ
ncbi:hypothetical protein [Massilia psychrophila]|jgi:hypothetical protein|nr:hypothetical protein [Massilia psychrophila]